MKNTTDSAYRIWREGHIVPGRIALARVQRDLPQQCVANVCGTDIETVDLWEQGVEYPSWAEMDDLCEITGMSMEFFARPVRGPGAVFAVPEAWKDDEEELEMLQGEFCEIAVEGAVFGWPMSLDAELVDALG